MAGVTAAWELSRPGWRSGSTSITAVPARLAARRQGASTRAPTAGSSSTGSTCGSATTTTPSASCGSATPSSTGRGPIPPARSGPGATRSCRPPTSACSSTGGVSRLVGGPVPDERPRAGRRRARTPTSAASYASGGPRLAADLLRSARATPGSAGRRPASTSSRPSLRGIGADGLLAAGRRLRRASTTRTSGTGCGRHGAQTATVDGGLVRGMYDLVFAYRDGDRSEPGVRCRARRVPRPAHVPRLQGRHLLEDDRGHGRRRLRADAPGARASRRRACATSTGSTRCGSRRRRQCRRSS